MPNYGTFDQLLAASKPDNDARLALVKRWLSKTYNIDFESHAGIFTDLTRVHDHDNQPKHFGSLNINTPNGEISIGLMKHRDKWRLALTRPGASNAVPIPALSSPTATPTEDLRYLTDTILANLTPVENANTPEPMPVFENPSQPGILSIPPLYEESGGNNGGLLRPIDPAWIPNWLLK